MVPQQVWHTSHTLNMMAFEVSRILRNQVLDTGSTCGQILLSAQLSAVILWDLRQLGRTGLVSRW